MPQPYFVPVNPMFSRITQSSGVSGSTSTSIALPLIVSFAMAFSLNTGESCAMLYLRLKRIKRRLLDGRLEHAPRGGVACFLCLGNAWDQRPGADASRS